MKQKNILISIVAIFIVFIAILYNFLNSKEEYIEIENIISNTITNEIVLEEISRSEVKIENMKIHITGEIKNPGVIELPEGSRIIDAIEKAGGITEEANLENVNLAYELEDGQKLYIPNVLENKINYISNGIDENVIKSLDEISKNSLVNINKASEIELQKIPGVGPAMAERIILYREENGKFKSIDDIKNISGIGEKKFESIKKYISVK